MTDGERIVWSVSFALALDRRGDATAAVQAAAVAVEQLRAAAIAAERPGSILQLDERDFLDEIVSVP